MNEYVIYFATQFLPPIRVMAKGVIVDHPSGQKIFHGDSEADIIAVAAPDTTIRRIVKEDKKQNTIE